MPVQNRRILFIGFGSLLICSVLYITANALPLWGQRTSESRSETFGLWGMCVSTSSVSTCGNGLFDMSTDKYYTLIAARVFLTLSCILSLFGVLIFSILLITEIFKKTILVFAKILSFGSLIGGILGMAFGIAFAIKVDVFTNNLNLNIGVSSVLAIISVVFNLVGTITTLIIK